MPCRPQEGKWTKVSPCVLWFQLISTMGVLKMLIPRSYSAMCYQIQRDPDRFNKDHSAYNSEVAYSEVQGTMLKTFEVGVRKAGNDELVTIFAIVLEPIAWLTRHFLRMSSLPRRRKMQLRGLPPPLASLASLEHSVVTLVLEYYSFVLSGRAPMLKLLRSLGGQ